MKTPLGMKAFLSIAICLSAGLIGLSACAKKAKAKNEFIKTNCNTVCANNECNQVCTTVSGTLK